MVALDWRKAFDSVNVHCLLDALRRLGIPSQLIQLIAALIRDRSFTVSDCGVTPQKLSMSRYERI